MQLLGHMKNGKETVVSDREVCMGDMGMQQIVPPNTLAHKILGEQRLDAGTSYRLSTHCVRIELPEGVLLYHTLTGEILLLSYEEAEQIDEMTNQVPMKLTGLVSSRFLMPQKADDMALADLMRNIVQKLNKKGRILTDYLIFTTTACNAHCFYCFEEGIQKATMSEETAKAAGNYIADHCGGNPVNLVWFGGEPLLNVKAIDTIVEILQQKGVEYKSRIDSNGYLFDESIARRAKDNWKVYEVQIPVDGTEKIYNQRKAYVNAHGSPYQRVLRSIRLLLDAGVQVRVRLNMDEDNEEDLYHLVDELSERFGSRSNFCISLRAIIENKGAQPYNYTETERYSLAEKVKAMWAYLDSKGIAVKRSLQQSLVLYSCWSDKVNASTITPDGHLGRCESHINKGLWGSVFSDERDEQVLEQWRERRPLDEHCYTCALYPRCVRLKQCVIRTDPCSAIERAEMGLRLQRAILSTYEMWKAEHMKTVGAD